MVMRLMWLSSYTWSCPRRVLNPEKSQLLTTESASFSLERVVIILSLKRQLNKCLVRNKNKCINKQFNFTELRNWWPWRVTPRVGRDERTLVYCGSLSQDWLSQVRSHQKVKNQCISWLMSSFGWTDMLFLSVWLLKLVMPVVPRSV